VRIGLRTLRFTTLLIVALILPACKIQVDVPVGGSVEILDYDVIYELCPENSHCVREVRDSNIIWTFIAVPNEGYEFVEWARGDRHLFGGETGMVSLGSPEAQGNKQLESLLKSDETFYLRPVFALDGFNTDPIGLPVLYQLDCDTCEGPQQIDWPASIEYQRNLHLWGDGGAFEGVLTLGTFVLYANDYDYQIENVVALDDRDESIASFVNVYEGQVIRKGEQLLFSLATRAPYPSLEDHTIGYEFTFNIAGTDAQFNVTITSVEGDRCPLC